MLVGIKEAAKELGVRPETLRRWEAAGKIDPPVRTPGGKRRYDLAKLRGLAPHNPASAHNIWKLVFFGEIWARDEIEAVATECGGKLEVGEQACTSVAGRGGR